MVWALYPYFMTSRTLFLSLWCDAFSINAIGESNGKSQLSKYFQNSFTLKGIAGYMERGV